MVTSEGGCDLESEPHTETSLSLSSCRTGGGWFPPFPPPGCLAGHLAVGCLHFASIAGGYGLETVPATPAPAAATFFFAATRLCHAAAAAYAASNAVAATAE